MGSFHRRKNFHAKIFDVTFLVVCLVCWGILAGTVAARRAQAQGSTDVGDLLSPGGVLQNAEKLSGIVDGLEKGSPVSGFKFSWAKIWAYFIFGVIGFAAFVYGKKQSSWRPLVIGLALMGYPCFVSSTFALYAIGVALTACLYFFRE